ncbi:SRPBCC domain-containing protein [Antarctobacter sp.]|uniref:SRPBCC domain-containing protein n=1 Tax=Antarctobacter sp. TaxID=1872577 RepID=UPI003A90296B
MDFETLTLQRKVACPPARLFHLLTDRDARATWGAPNDDVSVIIDTFDMRPGGREVSRCGPKDAPHFAVTTDFHVVDAPARLICTETLDMGDGPVSVSLITQQVSATAQGCLLSVTLQIASLSGPALFDDYKIGWNSGLDNLVRLAEVHG